MKLGAIYVGTWYVTSRISTPGKVIAVKRNSTLPIAMHFGKLGTAHLHQEEVVREALQEEIDRAARRDRDRDGCVCLGLGVHIDWNGSTSEPAYELRLCEEHAPPKSRPVDDLDRASARVDECLEAIASIRDILWPNGKPAEDPGALDSIERVMNFLRPTVGR